MNSISRNLFFLKFALMILLFFNVNGCDVLEDRGEEESDPVNPHFSYEISDEEGNVLKQVSHEFVDHVEIETGLGLFGNQFYPPWIVEMIVQETGMDPENLNLERPEIWLHSEHGVQEEIHFSTLNFKFPGMDEWRADIYHVVSLMSKEYWWEYLRHEWERIRSIQYGESSPIEPQSTRNIPEFRENSVIVNYRESGFGLNGTHYLFLPHGGHVELISVSDDVANGNFSIDLAALPAVIISPDTGEFPEQPEYRDFQEYLGSIMGQ